MSSPPRRTEEPSAGAGLPKGHIASPPRRHEQRSTNNPDYHPGEHPQVLREFPAKYDKDQEVQSPEGTHQSGVFVAEGHASGGGRGPSGVSIGTSTGHHHQQEQQQQKQRK